MSSETYSSCFFFCFFSVLSTFPLLFPVGTVKFFLAYGVRGAYHYGAATREISETKDNRR